MVSYTGEAGRLLSETLVRPWFALYHQRVPRERHCEDCESTTDAADNKLSTARVEQPGPAKTNLSPVEQLPGDVLRSIFELLSPADLASVSRVCRTFLSIAFDPALWRRHCLEAWGDRESLTRLTAAACGYGGWRRMLRSRAHLQFHGLYIQKQQYLRIGGDDGTGSRRVFFISFYRYLRFFPGGKVVGMTTPEDPLVSRARLQSTRWEASHQSWHHENNAGPGAGTDQVVPAVGDYQFDEKTRMVSVTLPIYQPRYAEMQGALACYVLELSDADGRPRGANDMLRLLEHSTLSADGSAPLYHEVKPSQALFYFTPFGSQYRRVAEKLFADPEDVKMFNRVQLMQRPARLQTRRTNCTRTNAVN